MVKNLPVGEETQETREDQEDPLGREDPQEEGIVTHFNILAWRIPWTDALVSYS